MIGERTLIEVAALSVASQEVSRANGHLEEAKRVALGDEATHAGLEEDLRQAEAELAEVKVRGGGSLQIGVNQITTVDAFRNLLSF